jgi:hypothetical protein
MCVGNLNALFMSPRRIRGCPIIEDYVNSPLCPDEEDDHETVASATTLRVLDFPTYGALAQRVVDLRRGGKEVLLRL